MPDRFWIKVDKSGDCWEWVASSHSKGYGRFRYDGKLQAAHRVSYQIVVGPIPGGMVVMHKCDNPKCVRPDHLQLGTVADNNRDRIVKGRYGSWNKGLRYNYAPDSGATNLSRVCGCELREEHRPGCGVS